jgi:hypothetical protein
LHCDQNPGGRQWFAIVLCSFRPDVNPDPTTCSGALHPGACCSHTIQTLHYGAEKHGGAVGALQREQSEGGAGREIPAQVLRNGAQPNMREPPYFHSPPSSRVRKSCGGPGLLILIHVSQGLAGWFHVEMATSGTSFWRACPEGGLFLRGLAVNALDSSSSVIPSAGVFLASDT